MFGGLKQQSQIKKFFGKITLYLFNVTQQCAVAGLPRETNDGYFDAENANKSCVRVHGGQSSEFPIYHTTRERGISLTIHRLRNILLIAINVVELLFSENTVMFMVRSASGVR